MFKLDLGNSASYTSTRPLEKDQWLLIHHLYEMMCIWMRYAAMRKTCVIGWDEMLESFVGADLRPDHASESLQQSQAGLPPSKLTVSSNNGVWHFSEDRRHFLRKVWRGFQKAADHLSKEALPFLQDAEVYYLWSPAPLICERGGGGAQDQAGERLQHAGEARQWKGGGASGDTVR